MKVNVKGIKEITWGDIDPGDVAKVGGIFYLAGDDIDCYGRSMGMNIETGIVTYIENDAPCKKYNSEVILTNIEEERED